MLDSVLLLVYHGLQVYFFGLESLKMLHVFLVKYFSVLRVEFLVNGVLVLLALEFFKLLKLVLEKHFQLFVTLNQLLELLLVGKRHL